jgi:hypothetical protein
VVGRSWTTRFRRPDDATPAGINIAVGAVVIGIGCLLAETVSPAVPGGRIAVVAGALALLGLATGDWLASFALVIPAWMVMDGFLVNRLGDLSWQGRPDLDRLLALAAGALIGLVAGEVIRDARNRREKWHWRVLVHCRQSEFDEEIERRA